MTGYLIERCQGVGCSNWARLLTVPGTTYNDTGLVPNTSYSYRVKATDAAGKFQSVFEHRDDRRHWRRFPGWWPPTRLMKAQGTTVTDLSGNGNTGTLTNATWTNTAVFGNALAFNGSNSLVTINDSAFVASDDSG